MASRSVNVPKSCNFSTLRWKVSTSFKLADTELEGRTRCSRRQLLVGEQLHRHGVGVADKELASSTRCWTLEHHVGGFERGGNFPSQSGKVARFRAIHTSSCHLFTAGEPAQTFHSAMESFHLVQTRQRGVGTSNDEVGDSNTLLASLNEMETFHRRVESLRWLPSCEQMATRGVNGPKSCNFSTLRWKVSTSFKPSNVMFEGPTTCWRCQLLVGDGPNLTVHGKKSFFSQKREPDSRCQGGEKKSG